MSDGKLLFLGTALWGWGVDEKMAHRMIDIMAARGDVIIDTATNYPINRNPEQHGLAVSYLSSWLIANKNSKIKIFCKYGSVDNSGSATCDLSRTATIRTASRLRDIFEDNLFGLGIHWDKRTIEDDIAETLDALEIVERTGIRIGFSGVAQPQIYASLAPQKRDRWWIQVKENVSTSAAREAYQEYFPKSRYIVYGINMGGLKSTEVGLGTQSSLDLRGIPTPPFADRLRDFLHTNHGIEPRPADLNELAMAMMYSVKEISGIIIGPRTTDQLIRSLDFWDRMQLAENDVNAVNLCRDYISKMYNA